MTIYTICRMLDGSYKLDEAKLTDGATVEETHTDEIKALVHNGKTLGCPTPVLMEVVQEATIFKGGEVYTDVRLILVPGLLYRAAKGRTVYAVPLTADNVKLPHLSVDPLTHCCDYINPTLYREKPKAQEGGAE